MIFSLSLPSVPLRSVDGRADRCGDALVGKSAMSCRFGAVLSRELKICWYRSSNPTSTLAINLGQLEEDGVGDESDQGCKRSQLCCHYYTCMNRKQVKCNYPKSPKYGQVLFLSTRNHWREACIWVEVPHSWCAALCAWRLVLCQLSL